MLYQDDDALFGECDPVGEPVFCSLDGKKFYAEVDVHHIRVRLGDCVRVNLETDEDISSNKKSSSRNDVESFGYCQVFAIYDDPNPDAGVQIEARWFLTPEEIDFSMSSKRKRM